MVVSSFNCTPHSGFGLPRLQLGDPLELLQVLGAGSFAALQELETLCDHGEFNQPGKVEHPQ